MRRSRRTTAVGSLDLFLDTISNTFGGVLFVALLVAILLRMTSKAEALRETDQTTEIDMLEMKQRLAEATTELDALRRAEAQLPALDSLADPKAVELNEELKQSEELRRDLLGSKLDRIDRIAELQSDINQTVADIKSLDEQELQLAQEHEQLSLDLADEVKSRTQDAELPRTRRTSKSEVVAILRYGRFYIWHKYDDLGFRQGLNRDEFVVLGNTPSGVESTPKPNAGTIIDESESSLQKLESRLSRFNAGRQYIAVVVWPDSFAQFQNLKKVLVGNRFEYRLTPAMEGDAFVDRGGTGARTQ